MRTGSWGRKRGGHRGGEMGTRVLLRAELDLDCGIPSKKVHGMDDMGALLCMLAVAKLVKEPRRPRHGGTHL